MVLKTNSQKPKARRFQLWKTFENKNTSCSPKTRCPLCSSGAAIAALVLALICCCSVEDLVLIDKNPGIEDLGIAWASQSYVEKSETRTDDWKSSDKLDLDIHKAPRLYLKLS